MQCYFVNFIEIIFGFCLFINAALFIPQAMTIYKTKSTNNLSLATFLGFNIIQAVTILHGYINQDFVLMFGTMVGFFTCGIVTILIIVYKK